jgi:uncharacterized protein YbbC (DUF1343 family)
LRSQFPPDTVRSVTPSPRIPTARNATGIDLLLADSACVEYLRTHAVGLLTHDACRTMDGTPTHIALAGTLSSSGNLGLTRLFTPEHGLAAIAPAGTGIDDGADPDTGLPVVSLYGPRFAPDAGLLRDLDCVIVDLRDVGVRCFTYAATAARLIAAAASGRGPEIIVCDRPNPLGAGRAGPWLDPSLRSLVAWLDVPFVHGHTLGTLLERAAATAGLTRFRVFGCDVADGTEQPWIPPSPALDHPRAVDFYPGLVLLEGTNLCEGRGTPWSFRSVAAPWLDTVALIADIERWAMPLLATATMLTPVTGRYAGIALPALTLGLTDRKAFDGLAFGVHLLGAIAARHPEFAWSRIADGDPAMVGCEDGYRIDALLGSSDLRRAMSRGDRPQAILARWRVLNA